MVSEDKAKHTSGRWTVSPIGAYTDFGGQSRVILGNGIRIAVVHASKGYGESDTESKANADLMVAAPELLGALKSVVASLRFHTSGFPEYSPEVQKIKEADAIIAKATGGAA